MLVHLFDRLYVVTKFIFPMMDDLKLSPIIYKECKCLNDLGDNDNEEIKTCIKDLITCCIKLRPYMSFYKVKEYRAFYTIGDIKLYIKQYAQCHLKYI